MSQIPYVCLYRSYLEELQSYSDAEVGRLIRALLTYLVEGTEVPLRKREQLFWHRMKLQHDRDAQYYNELRQIRIENGKKGGRPKKKPDGFENEISKAKHPIEKEKEIEKEIEKEKEKDSLSLGGEERENFSFPSLNDVLVYASENGLKHLDARHFMDYYEAVGWKCGGKPMESWKAMARLWDKKAKDEAPKAQTVQNQREGTRYGDYI